MLWIIRAAAALIVTYIGLAAGVALAMVQPPERFGAIMTRAPMAIVWGVLPGKRLWTWARRGALEPGDAAPDFTLATFDHSDRVTLSSHRGRRPVVIVFGSYT